MISLRRAKGPKDPFGPAEGASVPAMLEIDVTVILPCFKGSPILFKSVYSHDYSVFITFLGVIGLSDLLLDMLNLITTICFIIRGYACHLGV